MNFFIKNKGVNEFTSFPRGKTFISFLLTRTMNSHRATYLLQQARSLNYISHFRCIPRIYSVVGTRRNQKYRRITTTRGTIEKIKLIMSGSSDISIIKVNKNDIRNFTVSMTQQTRFWCEFIMIFPRSASRKFTSRFMFHVSNDCLFFHRFGDCHRFECFNQFLLLLRRRQAIHSGVKRNRTILIGGGGRCR